MRVTHWVGAGLCAVLVCGAGAIWLTGRLEAAQGNADSNTVGCLAQRLTHEEKQLIAKFTALDDLDSLWKVYEGVFPRCVVRSDQWERKRRLMTYGRQSLAYDPEFEQMRRANMQLASQAQ